MKIYTKTGDGGQTSLVGGTRVRKNDLRLAAYGTSDELNSFIGLLRAEKMAPEDDALLHFVQNRLFNLGAILATEQDKKQFLKGVEIKDEDIEKLEKEIDNITAQLPQEFSFILPAGNRRVALCHVCRTITRRLEREMISLTDKIEVEANCMKFVNRLSDYLFVLAKKTAKNDKCEVFLWEKA